MLNLRHRVANRLLKNRDVMKKMRTMKGEKKKEGTYPHCMRTNEKKYTLCASNRRSFVKRGQAPYFRARDEKGTPFDCRYQNELFFYNVKSLKKRKKNKNKNLQGTSA